jgi:hypothetical protein
MAVGYKCSFARKTRGGAPLMASSDDSIRENDASEPIVPPASKNLLPMGDVNLDSVREFVQEFVLDEVRQAVYV